MDGNARPHRAKVAKRYLQQETIERRDWSVKISDLRDLIPIVESVMFGYPTVPKPSVLLSPS
jgi:hypothetical protein